MEKAKKRFVISFSDSVTQRSDIAKILLIDEDHLLDSIDYFQKTTEMSREDIIFYEGLNQASLELSKAEADNLRKTKGIFAVEEDFELTIAEGNGVYPPEELEFLKNARSPKNGIRSNERRFNYSQFVNQREEHEQRQRPENFYQERRQRFQGNNPHPNQFSQRFNEEVNHPRNDWEFQNQRNQYPPNYPPRANSYQPEYYYQEFERYPQGQNYPPNYRNEWDRPNYYQPQPNVRNSHFAPPQSPPMRRPMTENRSELFSNDMSRRTNERYYEEEFQNRPIQQSYNPIHIPPPRKTSELSWNIKVIEAQESWTEVTGKGVNVAVFDTGIAPHKDLNIYDGVSFVPHVKSFNDEHGHGTHVAGIIGSRSKENGCVGVAPEAKIFAVKVLDDTGKGKMSWILAGLSWAIRSNMNVISLGCTAPVSRVAAFDVAIEKCNEAGITVVCAAGNSNNTDFTEVNAPANSIGAIAVGAIDQNYRIAEFSSRGGENNPITITAPGTGIVSTNLEHGFYKKSGTSMASPHVTGLVALIKEKYPTIDPEDIKDRIIQTASDLGYPEKDPVYGAGLVNCYRAIQ